MNKLLIIKRFKQQSNSWLDKISSSFEQAAISKALSEKGKNPHPFQSSIRNEWVGWMENLSLIRSKAALLPTLLFFCWVSACKEKDELPAPTQTGANTFGCYVDGRKWVPQVKKESFNNIPPIIGGYQPNENSTRKYDNIFLSFTNRKGESIQLFLKNCHHPGRYSLNRSTWVKFHSIYPEYSYGLFSSQTEEVFVTNPRNSGFVDITTVDTLSDLLSGTFEFEAHSSVLKKSIKVSSGRFDINLRTINN